MGGEDIKTAAVPIESIYAKGGSVETVKIALFAETDSKGEVFYKTEAQNIGISVAISFTYDLEKAVKEGGDLLRHLLIEQTKCLEKRDKKNSV